MTRNIKRKFIATLCAMTMIVGNLSISTYADEAALEITKQPTVANPTVTVNKEDVSYQWYKAEKAEKADEYEVADLVGTIVDGEILASANADNYAGDGVWANETGKIVLRIGIQSGDILKVTPQDGYEITAVFSGMGYTLTDDGTGVLVYEATRDYNTKLSILPVTEGDGVSAKIEIVRDGVTYPVVDGMKDVVDGAICAYVDLGNYGNDGKWASHSNGGLAVTLYLRENQTVNFIMDNIVLGEMYIYSSNNYEYITIPSGGVYSYSVLEEGLYEFYIDNDVSFGVDITVGDIFRGQAVTGQTTDTLTAFEEGELYSCLITSGEEEVWSDYIIGTLMIKTQPTATNPIVELNYDVEAAYQWYNVVGQKFTVVDSDEPADDEIWINYIYGGYYSEGTWYSVDYEDYWFIDASVVASMGDKVVITLPDGFDGIVYDWDTADEFNYNNGVYEYTIVNEDGYLNFTIESEEEFTAKIQLEKRSVGEAIEGETKATLQNYEYGKAYVCKIITEDDVEMVSKYVDMYFAISSQPTATNPVVEVNFPDMVSKYQWYEVEQEKYDVVDESLVTSENADEVIGAQAEDGVYEDGVWTSEPYDMGTDEVYDIIVCFEVEEGYLIKIVPSTPNITGSMWMTQNTYGVLKYENGVYYIEADSSEEYVVGLMASEEFTAEITMERIIVGEAVEGQTTKKLTNHEVGEYICELTLTDGTIVSSYMVSIAETDITHTYTDEYDADCNDCGATREVPERETETTTGTDGSGTETETTTGADGSGTETDSDSGAGIVSPNTADSVDMMLLLLLACAGIIGTVVVPVLSKRRYQ